MPTYDPNSWNDNGPVQNGNNCYDYAVDQKSGKPPPHKSQPGRAAGAQWTSPASCTGVGLAAVADGMTASSQSATCPTGCWKVALAVMQNGGDYHWYREDTPNHWSHKPGHGRATQFDSSNHVITDPATADRGPYGRFCGYYCVCPPIVVAALPQTPGSGVFAEILISGTAVLASADLELALPKGNLVLSYRKTETPMTNEKPDNAVIATALIFSGREDPTWTLSEEDVNLVRDLIIDLPRSEQEVESVLGYSGFRIDAGAAVDDFPQSLNVLNGIITTTDPGGERHSFEDSRGLERWLVGAACKSGVADELHYVMTESARRMS